MRFLVFIMVISLAFGCSPQKRLQRLVKKHPELMTKDTILITDTTIIPDYVHDTTTIFKYHDSVTVINNERIKIKYFYDTVKETIHHEYVCIGDTITKTIPVPYETVIVKELTWWQKYGSIIIVGAVLLLVLLILKKIGKIAL